VERRRPTEQDLQAALKKTIPDLIKPGLDVLFVGINPGRYSAYHGHHFAGPANRLWPALFGAGFTPRRFTHEDLPELLDLGLGITNLVDRPSAKADEVTTEELLEGAKRLRRKIRKYGPKVVAIVGYTAYRIAFRQPKATGGRQADLEGAAVWLLPNPSGLNAHHPPAKLVELFRELRAFCDDDRA
jgi:TDG/mug DNA glycosylase family protein